MAELCPHFQSGCTLLCGHNMYLIQVFSNFSAYFLLCYFCCPLLSLKGGLIDSVIYNPKQSHLFGQRLFYWSFCYGLPYVLSNDWLSLTRAYIPGTINCGLCTTGYHKLYGRAHLWQLRRGYEQGRP